VKVVYDVSVFGSVHKHPRARTGVHRVVDRVARGLHASGECDLAFTVTESIYAYLHAQEHLATHPYLHDVPILRPRRGLKTVRALGGLTDRAARASALPGRLLHRGMFRAMRLAERALHRPDVGPPCGAEVFHSPYAALPPQSVLSAPARFLTVYDLIPVRYPHFFDAGLVRQMERVYRSLGAEDWAFAISETTRADICEHRGVDPDRVFVTPLAADPALFHPDNEPARQAEVRRRYGIPSDSPYLLSLNTLEPRKNMDRAIGAFVRLVEEERLPDLRFVLVGAAGWKYENIFDAVSRSGSVRDRIVMTGYVAEDDLAPLYSGALAFVYPSLYEGFGLPPLEAMQCGTPVITSNTSSLPEVVGDAGIMVDPLDQDALCDALSRVHGSAALRRELSRRSLARARQFSWERCIDQTLAAYRTALS
jgi:glycosyltransferase involved in cell wall biosynthesis